MKRRLLRLVGALGVLLCAIAGVLLALAWRPAGQKPRGARLDRVEASPQYRDGQFANVLPEEMDVWGATKRWLWQGGDQRAPVDPMPVAAPTDLDVAPASGLRITYLGHSSMLIEIGGRRFLTDPVWGERASPFTFLGPKRFFEPLRALSDLPKLDAVVLSHDHYDHLDQESIVELNRLGVPFVTPLGLGAHLEYWGVPAERITELDWWQTTNVGGVELACTPARHFSGRFLADRNKTLWASWAFVGPAHRVYFSGDTAMFPGFAEIGAKFGPFDVTLMEAGAYDKSWADVHLGPEQAVEAHVALRGALMVPVHWGTFDLAVHNWTEPAERLVVAAAKAGVKLFIPEPGASFEPMAAPETTRWWPDVPWETAEENPVVSSGLSVSEG